MKKRILAGVIALVFLIPSVVFATSYLADDIFGSFSAIEERGGTEEDYEAIEGFLQETKGKLTEDEFKEYMELTEQLMQLKLKITDKNGVTHKEDLTDDEQQLIEQLEFRLAPLFEKINDTAKP